MLQSMGSQRIRHDSVTEQTVSRWPAHCCGWWWCKQRGAGREGWVRFREVLVKREKNSRTRDLV